MIVPQASQPVSLYYAGTNVSGTSVHCRVRFGDQIENSLIGILCCRTPESRLNFIGDINWASYIHAHDAVSG